MKDPEMNKRILLIVLALMLLVTIACVGTGEVNRAAATQITSNNATATSAAQEFYIQLTLTAPTPVAISP
jgi:hypothetical protein